MGQQQQQYTHTILKKMISINENTTTAAAEYKHTC